MTPEEEKYKLDALSEQEFKKKWAKHLKLSPIEKNVKRNVGKAPKCGVNDKPIKIAIETKPVNKKKR